MSKQMVNEQELRAKAAALGNVAAIEVYDAALHVQEMVLFIQGEISAKQPLSDGVLKQLAGVLKNFNDHWMGADHETQKKLRPIISQVISPVPDMDAYKFSGAL